MALIAFVNVGRSTHILGGDFSSRHLVDNEYSITLKLFRDCETGLAPFDASITVGIFDYVTNTMVQSFVMTLGPVTNIDLGDECFQPDMCIEEGIYQTIVTIPNNSNEYYLAWERCCRKNGIDNILNSGDAGMTYYHQIGDPRNRNNSPVFGSYPAEGYLCLNSDNVLDFNVTEPDGDSLVFSLVDPFNGYSDTITPAPVLAQPAPYPTIQWQAPYSLTDIVGGTPAMRIDRNTGLISARPAALGVFTFAVLIEEYRNGTRISLTRREITYLVLPCTQDNPPVFLAFPDTIRTTPLTTTCFDVVAEDINSQDVLELTITSALFDSNAVAGLPDPSRTFPQNEFEFSFINQNTQTLETVTTGDIQQIAFNKFSAVGKIGARFCWETECNDLVPGNYNLRLETFSNGCSSLDTSAFKDVVVQVLPFAPSAEAVPNVFTPGDDAKNDTYKLTGIQDPCLDNVKISIFNRWGNKVYETNDPNFEWDGKNKNGKSVSSGTYFIFVEGVYGGKTITNNFPVTIFNK